MDGEYANGDYVLDMFHIGGGSVKNLQFGIGLDATSPQGIMGIGFRTNEVSAVKGDGPYDNLAYAMASQGIINSVAYSIWLNDLHSSKGEILFGGIDTKKYHGSLFTLPIDKRVDEA